MIKALLAVFLGGGFGSVLRYVVQLLLHERIVAYHFPWATFMVNVIGSFLIGLFYALSEKLNLSSELRLFLTAGLCGGFTTFSTFSNDCLAMIRQGAGHICMIYIILSIILGILACFFGGYVATSRP